MDAQLITDLVVFWPIAVAGAVMIGGLALLVGVLWVVECVAQMEGFIQSYAECGAPQWARRQARKGV